MFPRLAIFNCEAMPSESGRVVEIIDYDPTAEALPFRVRLKDGTIISAESFELEQYP